MRNLTTDELIQDVRSLLDEENNATLDDEADIIPALNRAQDVAANILSRHYESPLITNKTVQLQAGQDSYQIPEEAFEQRLEKVEVFINRIYYPIKRLNYRDVSLYETPTRVNVPYYYVIIGQEFKLLPSPTAAYPLRIWYIRDPEPLAKQQGRIQVVNEGANYVTVDAPGSKLTTEMDQLGSYVSIVDGNSGLVKGHLQILSITDGKITFRGTPVRTSVQNCEIVGTLTDMGVQPDDYLAPIGGTCIPAMKKPWSNYLIQYAVAELNRKLGGDTTVQEQVRKELEQIVERSWVGRESSLRVTKRNKNWEIPTRRFFNN